MILSNNPRTYITLITHRNKYGTKIYLVAGISLKYIRRWAGSSSIHTSDLCWALWYKKDIKI